MFQRVRERLHNACKPWHNGDVAGACNGHRVMYQELSMLANCTMNCFESVLRDYSYARSRSATCREYAHSSKNE